jgi:hypothetical protein
MKVASKSCEHFEQFRPNRSIFIGKNQDCKQCSAGKDNLWLCLTVIEFSISENVRSSTAAATTMLTSCNIFSVKLLSLRIEEAKRVSLHLRQCSYS